MHLFFRHINYLQHFINLRNNRFEYSCSSPINYKLCIDFTKNCLGIMYTMKKTQKCGRTCYSPH